MNSHIQDVAKRFAREGYLVISPELFHRERAAGLDGRVRKLRTDHAALPGDDPGRTGRRRARLPRLARRVMRSATARASAASAIAWEDARPSSPMARSRSKPRSRTTAGASPPTTSTSLRHSQVPFCSSGAGKTRTSDASSRMPWLRRSSLGGESLHRRRVQRGRPRVLLRRARAVQRHSGEAVVGPDSRVPGRAPARPVRPFSSEPTASSGSGRRVSRPE